MQSAAGSLRGAGPSRSVSCDDATTFWGVGSDGLALSGHYDFRVVQGSVSICGITLSLFVHRDSKGNETVPAAPSDWYHVSAPVPPYPVIFAAHSIGGAVSIDIPDEISTFSAIIQVRNSQTPQSIAHLAPPYKSLWHDLMKIENPGGNVVHIPKSWIELISSRMGTSEHQFVIFGPKNSGKSSLAKYLCNKLLSSAAARIFYLELDPGQPEFTPPGNITLHEVTFFNFSPAYSHANFPNSIKSHHLGDTSPMENPRRYLYMCGDLLRAFHSRATSSDFLVVNTPGWTKGLGLDLNSEIARMFDPHRTCAVHLGPSEFEIDLVEVERFENNGGNPNSMTTITASGFSAAELRSLQIMCYFHQHSVDHITTWSPYQLDIGAESGITSLSILDSAGINLQEDVPVCLEGTLVSINVLDDNAPQNGILLTDLESDELWRHSNSVGMGVIQYISDDLKFLRLLTPLDPQSLDLGNKRVVLVRGRIQLPIWELHNREILSESPWVSSGKALGSGATYTKFRRNIRRN